MRIAGSTLRIDGWILIEQFRHLDTKAGIPEWMRQVGEPLANHHIDFSLSSASQSSCKRTGVLAGQYAIVQGFEANTFLGQLAFDPFRMKNQHPI